MFDVAKIVPGRIVAFVGFVVVLLWFIGYMISHRGALL